VKIFIPSYNRPWTATTPQLLDAEGTPYVLILKDREQADLYRNNPAFRQSKIAILDGGGIADAREACREELNHGEWCLQMDDNVRGFRAAEPDVYRHHEKPEVSPGERPTRRQYGRVLNIEVSFQRFHDQVLLDSIAEAERRGAYIVGFSPFDNPTFQYKKWNDVSYVQNKVVLMRKTEMAWDQSNGFPAMEEYALLAAHLLKYARVLVNKWAHPIAGHYEPGGLGPLAERLPAKRAACADIQARFPGLFLPQRDGDLLLRWRELDQIERWRATSFSSLSPRNRNRQY
jgi:hypothetical protein